MVLAVDHIVSCVVSFISFSPPVANQLLSRYVSVHSNNNPFTTAVTNILLYFIGYHFPGTGNCSSSEVRLTAPVVFFHFDFRKLAALSLQSTKGIQK